MLRSHPHFFICFVLVLLFVDQAQAQTHIGTVSFVTSRSVYVTFEQTSDIQIGDTLLLATSESTCLLVSNKSSSSCVCTLIADCAVSKGDEIIFRPPSTTLQDPVDEPIITEADPVVESVEDTEDEAPIITEEARRAEQISGRFSVSEYSNIGSLRDDRHRFMSRFALTATHINHSRFSFETFLNFRQIFPTDESVFAPQTTFFRVYNLAVRYELDPSFSLVLGRRINPKIASLGAIDGLQAEKSFGNAYVGAIVGSRPDIQTFSFNPNLLQYGGYMGTSSVNKTFRSQTTLGVIEQRNTSKIDRRYLYFQHSSTIARKLNLFSSMEMDLYSSINGVSSTSIRLPNLFLSANYRINRKINLMASYDSRKRILYYETLQTEIERLLDDDLARQGIRVRINIRPIKYLSIGASFSNRFQSDQQNQSDNIHAFASWSKLPKIGGRLSATFNRNASNYLESNIFSIRHSRSLIKDKMTTDLYYRQANYIFVNSESSRLQHYYGVNLSYRFTRKLVLSLAGERSDFNEETNYRIYTRLIKRFDRRRK